MGDGRRLQMTAGSPLRSPRRELTVLILLGAAGAGLVLLAMRQAWAHIVTAAPKPLPASVIPVSGQALVPAAAALAVAALACLAAVLATRRLLRRIAGIVLAGLGAGIAVAVSLTISATDVTTAASSSGPRGAVGAGVTPGSGAGSTTAGTSGAGGTSLSGFPGHVAFVSVPWRWAALLGALVIVAAGALIAWRANRLPVMSSRYDLPAPEAGTRAAVPAGSGRRPASDSASMWESLSRGEDPTSGE
jgi:uncharacterized membrane protein (TIGR02234 family)